MKEIFHFVFESFWHFIGVLIIIGTIGNTIVCFWKIFWVNWRKKNAPPTVLPKPIFTIGIPASDEKYVGVIADQCKAEMPDYHVFIYSNADLVRPNFKIFRSEDFCKAENKPK